MGYRINFYRISKELLEKVKTVKNDEEFWLYNDELTKECMLYDTAYCMIDQMDDICGRLTDAELNCEEDMDNWYMDKTIYEKFYNACLKRTLEVNRQCNEGTWVDEQVAVNRYNMLMCVIGTAFELKKDYDTYNKWILVNSSYNLRDALVNYLYIYRTFDWENDVIYVCGG